MYKHFRPSPSRYGIQPAFVALAVPTVTANTTTTARIPTPAIPAVVESVSFNLSVLASDADGTLTVQLFKRDVSASADVAVSTAVSIETDNAVALSAKKIPLTGITDAARVLDGTDSLFVNFVSDSAAIDTQPVGFITVELALLN